MREYTVPSLATAPQVGGLADAVFEQAAAEPDRPAFGRKVAGHWRNVTIGTFRDEVVAVAKGLLAQGVRFGDRVGLMSRTRYEWTLFDFALWSIGAQPVPVYPTSSADQVLHILNDSAAVACIVEHEDHAMTVGSVIDKLPKLTRLWQLDADAAADLVAAGAHLDDDVVERHRLAVTPDSVATVIYTSGTTGRPRGCTITHANFMSQSDNIIERYPPLFENRPGNRPATLMFLPLSHVFGRMIEVTAIRGKIKLGHTPDVRPETLLPDLAAFRPSFILAVPHIFEKVFAAARRKAEAQGKADAFDKAADVAIRYAAAQEQRAFDTGPGPSAALRMQHQVFDKLVYAKIRASLGGRCRYAMSGGSAMQRRLGLFFAGAGLSVIEGYGLTESTAAAAANPWERPRYGTVGVPIPGMTVHIAQDGEIWLRGGQIFSGYTGEPQATTAVLRDGWLATGDVGELDDDGYLTITGRKKEMLVTSNGKTVSPVGLEDGVRNHPLVAQCLVVGNDRPYIAALITLEPEGVSHWLKMRDKPELTGAELVRDEELEAEIRRAVVAANTHVSQSESIRTFRIMATQFTEDQGLLTPSLKLKRKAIEKAYANEVEALYGG
ncbi:long-chain fatty acid--CoA ligase [Streptomyces sp. A7024]|uniref:Acyl-CoA synthetase n=1 Tax=Streptomyces coryli TaxID=1128680 RepID=A0A6G4TZJ7_9ACTN|nr:AMP-dependent synthetase/ligase [Streptomyces coryli]NGN64940.1 long-chain fatty acid--CoA ligase [Streptomyces coryli]